MGFSVGGSQGTSTILAELSIAEAQAAQQAQGGEVEGLTVPQGLTDPETLQQNMQQGLLRGDSKEFAFVKQQAGDLPGSFADSLLAAHRPLENKLADPKSPLHHLNPNKESLIKEKVFKTLEPHKSQLEGKSSDKTAQESSRTPIKPHDKADQTAREALSKGQTPPSPARIRENALKQHQTTSRNMEQRVHKELARKENREKADSSRNDSTARQESRQAERENGLQQHHKMDKNEEREQEHKKHRQDEEEGFAGGGQNGRQDQETDSDNPSSNNRTIDPVFAREFHSYASEDSILSEIFKMRVSQFDVLVLFLEIMKLDIKNRETHKLARREERELQISHMQKVVENYKEQAKWQLFSSLGSGALGIVSGAAPIAGHIKGEWIIEKLGGFIDSIRNMEKNKFFKGVQRITSAMSEMYKATGQIQNTFSEGHRTYDQHMTELYRADWEESTRTIDDIKDNWKSIENFLYQTLQMYHEAIRSLYN